MAKSKKVLKWAVLSAAALVGVAVIVNGILSWRTNAQLERRMAEIRESGAPVTLADLTREPAAHEENAAVILSSIENDVADIANKFQENLYETDSYEEGTYSEENYETIESAFEQYPQVVPSIEQAAACPVYNPQVDYNAGPDKVLESQLTRVQLVRSVARVVNERIELSLGEGKRDEALRTCIVLLRLTRHFDREPMMIGYLVALACRGIAANEVNRVLLDGPVSEDVRAALEEELAIHDPMKGFQWCLESERAFANARFGSMTGTGFRRFVAWPITKSHVVYLDVIDTQLELGATPAHEIRAELDTLKEKLRSHGPLVSNLLPNFEATRDAIDRTRARFRCLRVLNALQTHADEDGTQELQFSELALPEEATTDPFTGEPLILHRSPRGWTVYSVGENRKDDGGRLDGQHDFGAGVDLKPDE